jgi:hypothetical protein
MSIGRFCQGDGHTRAGNERYQGVGIAPLERKLLDPATINQLPERRSLTIEERSLRRHVQRLTNRANLHLQINAGHLLHH